MALRISTSIILILIFLFYPSVSFAVKMQELDVCGYDASNLDYIELHSSDLVEIKKEVWEESSKNSIAIKGRIFPSIGVNKVLYSLDGGVIAWRTEGEDPFYFTFVPKDGATHKIVIKFLDKRNDILFQKDLEIKYTSIDWEKTFKDKIEKIVYAYNDQDMRALKAFFDREKYADLDKLENGLKDTFLNNNKVKLSAEVKSFVVKKDEALVVVDWQKTFEEDSVQSGQGNEIGFNNAYGKWSVVSISDETMFIIGTGTVNVSY
jgi:plasmid maintenance system killer protein